jgi:hypothetical protein
MYQVTLKWKRKEVDEIAERYEKIIIIVRKYFLMGNQNSANIGAEEGKRKLSEFNMKHVMPR